MIHVAERLIIATHNRGKAHEIRTILGSTQWTIASLQDFQEVGEACEHEETFAGNAVSKASYYASAIGEWVLADDSGLEVMALDGAPGVRSARYAGPGASDSERRARLLSELALRGSNDRSARFICAAALATPNGEVVKVTEGICEGVISESPRGMSGFGYDPIFVPNGYDLTFGELSEEIKNRISHRARAILAMRAFLLDLR